MQADIEKKRGRKKASNLENENFVNEKNCHVRVRERAKVEANKRTCVRESRYRKRLTLRTALRDSIPRVFEI